MGIFSNAFTSELGYSLIGTNPLFVVILLVVKTFDDELCFAILFVADIFTIGLVDVEEIMFGPPLG